MNNIFLAFAFFMTLGMMSQGGLMAANYNPKTIKLEVKPIRNLSGDTVAFTVTMKPGTENPPVTVTVYNFANEKKDTLPILYAGQTETWKTKDGETTRTDKGKYYGEAVCQSSKYGECKAKSDTFFVNTSKTKMDKKEAKIIVVGTKRWAHANLGKTKPEDCTDWIDLNVEKASTIEDSDWVDGAEVKPPVPYKELSIWSEHEYPGLIPPDNWTPNWIRHPKFGDKTKWYPLKPCENVQLTWHCRDTDPTKPKDPPATGVWFDRLGNSTQGVDDPREDEVDLSMADGDYLGGYIVGIQYQVKSAVSTTGSEDKELLKGEVLEGDSLTKEKLTTSCSADTGIIRYCGVIQHEWSTSRDYSVPDPLPIDQPKQKKSDPVVASVYYKFTPTYYPINAIVPNLTKANAKISVDAELYGRTSVNDCTPGNRTSVWDDQDQIEISGSGKTVSVGYAFTVGYPTQGFGFGTWSYASHGSEKIGTNRDPVQNNPTDKKPGDWAFSSSEVLPDDSMYTTDIEGHYHSIGKDKEYTTDQSTKKSGSVSLQMRDVANTVHCEYGIAALAAYISTNKATVGAISTVVIKSISLNISDVTFSAK